MQTRSKTLSLLNRSSSVKQDNLLFSTPVKTKRSAEPAAPLKRARRQLIEDLRYVCDDSDNDSTSTYHPEDDEPISPRNLCDLFEPDFRYSGKPHSISPRSTEKRATEERAKDSQQRSSEERTEYAVEIDFGEASRAWRANKVLVGEGHFAYKCDKCDRRSVKDSNYCGVHRRGAAKKVM